MRWTRGTCQRFYLMLLAGQALPPDLSLPIVMDRRRLDGSVESFHDVRETTRTVLVSARRWQTGIADLHRSRAAHQAGTSSMRIKPAHQSCTSERHKLAERHVGGTADENIRYINMGFPNDPCHVRCANTGLGFGARPASTYCTFIYLLC